MLNAEDKATQMVAAKTKAQMYLVQRAAADQAGGVRAWGEHSVCSAGGGEGGAGDAGERRFL